MEPRALLQQLMDRDGLNSNSLAARLHNATTQPQIHKFLSGKAREPRRSTLAPVARYFRIPLDALYDADLADLAAKQKQLTSIESKTNQRLTTVEPTQEAINKIVSSLSADALMLASWLDMLPEGRERTIILQQCGELIGARLRESPASVAPALPDVKKTSASKSHA